MFLLFILFLAFISNCFPQTLQILEEYETEPCLGYNVTNNSCLTCSYNYHPPLALEQNISPETCILKTNQTYKKSIYISNKAACNYNKCDGSLSFP